MKQRLVRSIALLTSLILCMPANIGHAASTGTAPASATLTAPQLEQLVAPVALYPDALFSQILMASTYPLDVVAASRWLKANPNLKGQALQDAAKKQPWDPSVQALVTVPQVLSMMNDKLDWTEQLGNAFLAQPKDVMDAAQRLRAKAVAQGNLKSSAQQTVNTDGSGSSQTIVIESAQPSVVYVPTYDPMTIYGPWPYPAYPPYAWYPPGYVAATAAISFGFGVAVGYALWGDCDWHHGDVNINVNNYTHFHGGPPPPPPGPGPHGGGPNPPPPGFHGDGTHQAWQHDPAHRGNVPYPAGTGDRFQRPGTPTPSRGHAAQEAFRGRMPGADGGGIQRPDGQGGIQRPGGQGGGIQRPGTQSGLVPDGSRGTPFLGDRRPAEGDMFHPDGTSSRLPTEPNRYRDSGFSSSRLQTEPDRFQRDAVPHGGVHNDRLEDHSVFRPAQGLDFHNDFQRGAGSRSVMQAHPAGGGFHGGGHVMMRRR